jgi:hypothetical protein
MSAELFDLRAKITVETQCALAAYARAHDMDKAEVVRDVLHDWAVEQIHGATLLASCLRAKGLAGAAEGIAAQSGDSLKWDEQ